MIFNRPGTKAGSINYDDDDDNGDDDDDDNYDDNSDDDAKFGQV